MSVTPLEIVTVGGLLQTALMVFDVCASGLDHHPNNDDESERADESNDSLDRMCNNVPDSLPRIIYQNGLLCILHHPDLVT